MNKHKDYDDIYALYADRLSTPGTASKGQNLRGLNKSTG